MPIAAILENRILCVHGGISPDLDSLDSILNIMRPSEVPEAGLLCDLLWADFTPENDGWSDSDRGVSYGFGPDLVSEF